MAEWEAIFDDDGEHIGYVTEADDGATVILDLDEEIVAAFDLSTGDELDVSGYAVGDEEEDDDEYEFEDEYAEQVEGFDDRLAALEAQSWEPRPPQEVVVTRATSQADMQRVDEDMARQRDQAEAEIGRRFTLRERRLIGNEILDDVQAGRQPDLWAAVQRLEARGENLPVLDDDNPHRAREARVAHMTELWHDQERLANAQSNGDDLLNEQPPPTSDYFDLSDREQRVQYMTQRMEGRTTTDSAWDSTDVAEQAEQEEWT